MLTGVVSYSDYLAAHRLHRHKAAVVMNWLMVVVAIVGPATIFLGNWKWGIIILCGGIGGLAGEFFQAHFFLPRKVKKLYAQYKGIASPVTYEWDAERLIGRSEMGRGERQWKDYSNVKENDRVLLLYITDHLFEVIPKQWFREPMKLEEFRKFAKVGSDLVPRGAVRVLPPACQGVER